MPVKPSWSGAQRYCRPRGAGGYHPRVYTPAPAAHLSRARHRGSDPGRAAAERAEAGGDAGEWVASLEGATGEVELQRLMRRARSPSQKPPMQSARSQLRASSRRSRGRGALQRRSPDVGADSSRDDRVCLGEVRERIEMRSRLGVVVDSERDACADGMCPKRSVADAARSDQRAASLQRVRSLASVIGGKRMSRLAEGEELSSSPLRAFFNDLRTTYISVDVDWRILDLLADIRSPDRAGGRAAAARISGGNLEQGFTTSPEKRPDNARAAGPRCRSE